MVDSASGELKTCFGNSVESFWVRRKTPPFGSSTSSPKMMRPRVFRQAGAQCLVHDIADSVFARRQHFVVELRQLARDLQVQFVGRRILVAFRLDEFLPDALFDFLVELRVILRRDHSFGDQGCSFHFVERIALRQIFDLFRAAIKLVIIRAGVTGEPLHR